MARRTHIASWTSVDEPTYPPFLSIADVGIGVELTLRSGPVDGRPGPSTACLVGYGEWGRLRCAIADSGFR